MVMDRQETDVNIPSTVIAVVAEFAQRDQADDAVEAIVEAGFGTHQVSFVARGAAHDGDKFIPGALLVTVHADGRDRDAMRILQEHGATKVKCGVISATGEVIEERELEEEREEASSP